MTFRIYARKLALALVLASCALVAALHHARAYTNCNTSCYQMGNSVNCTQTCY